MKTLNWRHTDWNARNFIFFIGQEIIGQLNFNSLWNFNGFYTDKESKIQFKEYGGYFWKRAVSIIENDKIIGEITYNFFLEPKLKLVAGDTYLLTSNFWGRDVKWINAQNEIVMKYDQATMSSMGKGTITYKDSLSTETEKLLMTAGIYVRQLILKRASLLIVIMIPILTTASRHH